MATPNFQAVKCLNTSTSRRRFMFKTFSQRVEDINIDVFRSLITVKSEPKDVSSFFLEALLYWRELNTAEDFISFYEVMMPLVQTLPQIIHHKEHIFSELVGRLQMRAKLSLEPILMLIVAFSRDVLDEFLPFLQRLSSSLTNLLSTGGDHDPEVLEQVFTAWSYISMHLQKNFVKDVVTFLKMTAQLRYYPKDYVQEFMAEVVSFLLRNAPLNQLQKGIRNIILDVVTGSSAEKKIGATSLIWHVMKGSYSRLHSKARKVLLLLLDKSVLDMKDISQGSEAVLDVVNGVLHRLFEEIDHIEQKVVFECLHEILYDSISKGCLGHLIQLLSLLTTAIRLSNGGGAFDRDKMIELVRLLIQSYISYTEIMKSRDFSSEDTLPVFCDKILRLVLCMLDMPQSSSFICLTTELAPVFKMDQSSLLMFVKGLVHKDPVVVIACRNYIISAIDELIETSPDEVLFLTLELFERQTYNILQGIPPRTCSFFTETLDYWVKLLGNVANLNNVLDLLPKLAVLWGVIKCYPCLQCSGGSPWQLRNLIDIFDHLLETNSDSIAGVPVSIWQDLLGITLNSHHKLLHESSRPTEAYIFLHLAKRYKSSPSILSAVAEYLDSFLGTNNEAGDSQCIFSGIDAEDTRVSISIFADNLCLPNKEIRVLTLRIISHYMLPNEPPKREAQPLKKLKFEKSDSVKGFECNNVFNLLLLIETTPVSVSSSRKIVILISRLQMIVSSGKIHDTYAPLLLNAVIGILHNRFSLLWESALECLTTLIRQYGRIVWNHFVHCLEYYHSKSLSAGDVVPKLKSEASQPKTLIQCFKMYLEHGFDSTPCITVTTLLIQALQKIPDIAESHSSQLIPIFLKFLGYSDAETFSVESFHDFKCKGREWSSVLKEWLSLLIIMRNCRSLYQSQVLKDVLVNRLLDEIDSDIQLKAIDCLLNWKDEYLIPYDKHLKNLVVSKNLREELTTWAVSKDSEYIQEGHRAQLIPVIVRLLVPKVRKMKSFALLKQTGTSNRRAILCFLAQLEVDDLHLFFFLLLKPLFVNHQGTKELNEHSDGIYSIFSRQWPSLNLFNCSIYQVVENISLKKKIGFLYVLEDVLKTFDALHIGPFLTSLMTFVVLILKNCMSNIKNEVSRKICDSENGVPGHLEVAYEETSTQSSLAMSTSNKQFKDLRSLCLKIISSALNKHGSHDFGCEFWDIFFNSVKPLIDNFKHEGSSSENPSSLFSCFLAMSRSPMLALFLNREANLVPTIFSILTVRTASDSIISSVLNFIENLLNLNNDSDHDDDSIKAVFYPHLEVLIHSFHELILSGVGLQRKSSIFPGKSELRIFKMIVKYIKKPATAAQFLDMLLPIFKRKAIDFEDCLEALHVMKGVLHYLPSESGKLSNKILKSVFPILTVAELNVRLCICDIVNNLALVDPSLADLAKLLHGLNAMSSMDIGEFDYDTRVTSHEKIRSELFSSLGADHSLPILSHCIYDMSSGELILRQCAAKSLLAFVQFASSYLKICSNNSHAHHAECEQVSGTAVEEGSRTNWTKSSIQWVINGVFLKNIGKAMTKEVFIQKEWITLLHDMIYNLHEVPALYTFRPLCSDDPEVDFFNNILHLQMHRRGRALFRFRNVISAGNFTENIVVKIFVPLFLNMMFEVKDGKGEHIRNACLDSLASISSQMQWNSYRSFLMRCFREITFRPDKQKILIRLICAILDKFHFYIENSCERENDGSYDSICTDKPREHVIVALQNNCSLKSISPEIQSYLQKTVLLQIQKMLTKDSENVNINISIAAIKILKLLPMDTMDSQLSSIIHHICTFLKHHLESIRDEARSALAACTKELGLEYLHFIINVLRSVLKRGYEMHVLGYTLNFILFKALTENTTGSLDYCLEELISIAENDILGDVAEEKEVEKIASKMKETKKTKSFETLKLISQSITFRMHALKLLSPINKYVQKHLTPKTKRKLEIILLHIASGIECNPSAQTADLFIFVYGLIQDSFSPEFSHRKESTETVMDKESSFDVANKGKSLCTSDSGLKNSHLITVFALDVLHNRLKNMKLDKDQQLLSMLDPFVKQIGDCLGSKYEVVLSAAFRCLAPLLKLPLPSMDTEGDKIKSLLLSIVQRSGDAKSPLIQSCLKLLTVLLRSTRISISQGELHMLIRFPMFIDIQINPSTLALSLLKSIVARKLVVHEIYDIVLRVAELMVTSESEPIRRKCSQILLQFLLEYRLSDKRLQQHMDFLLSNLSYEHPSGRESVLEMLHAILIKFPKSVIDSQAQTFFLHLVVALANEQDLKVRSMVSTVLKELIGRASQQMLQPILEYTLSWYFGEKQYLWSPAAQVIGLLFEAWKGGLKKHIISIMLVTSNILKLSTDAVDTAECSVSKEVVVPFWKEAYYSLVMLEKMLLCFSELYFHLDFQVIWEMVCKFLLHPHIWLRNISGRLVALYFAAASQANRADSKKMNQKTLYLINPCRLYAIAVSLLKQLEAQAIDDATGNIITQNLAFSICSLHSFAKQRSSIPLHEMWSKLSDCEQSTYLESFDLLGSKKAKRIFLLSTSVIGQSLTKDQSASENGESLSSIIVNPLFRRLGKIAMTKENFQMKIIFNCLRTISSQIGMEGSHEYAIDILLPLYKVCEGFAGKVIDDEIKQLAEEVRDSVRDVLGAENFVQVYNQIRKSLKGKRDHRRNQHKLLAVKNPMLHAKRKLRVAAKNRALRRRTAHSLKMGMRRRKSATKMGGRRP